jgi:hypothetical protein
VRLAVKGHECKWYSRGRAQILAGLQLRLVVHRLPYEAAGWKFCPWCGERLGGSEEEVREERVYVGSDGE